MHDYQVTCRAGRIPLYHQRSPCSITGNHPQCLKNMVTFGDITWIITMYKIWLREEVPLFKRCNDDDEQLSTMYSKQWEAAVLWCFFITFQMCLWNIDFLHCQQLAALVSLYEAVCSGIVSWCSKLWWIVTRNYTRSLTLETVRLIAIKMLYVKCVSLCLRSSKFM